MTKKDKPTAEPVNLFSRVSANSLAVNRAALRKVSATVLPRKKGAKPAPFELNEHDVPQAEMVISKSVSVTKGKKVEPGRSKAVTEDPFIQLQKNGLVIEPPFDMLSLAVMPEHNSELIPVVETMETNIEGFGYRLVSRQKPDELDPSMKKAVDEEYVRLINFFNYANVEDSWTLLRRKLRKDLEVTGNAYLEVIRNALGDIQGFQHIPSYQMRLTPQEAEPIEIETPTLELQIDSTWKINPMRRWARFRKFVQSRAVSLQGSFARTTFAGYLVRWFKEFGDPRIMDNENGLFVEPSKVADWDGKGTPMPDVKRANEIIHFKLYCTRSPYGIPRYVGNLLSIVGDRASEEINFTTFRNNNIPNLALLVSNGQLTQGTIERLESFIESQVQGNDNYSKIVIIEAESPETEGEDQGNVKIDLKPLNDAQQKDAMFQTYSKNNKDNVRRAWRIPPIFVGQTSDYTRTTAETSRQLADEQVFAPERSEFDSFVNRRLFPEMGVIYHEFRSNTPNTTNNSELVAILAGAEKTGGMTPRIARMVLEDVLSQKLPDFPKDADFDPDKPFSLAMANAVKNQADASEPGQQVTALKSLQAMGYLGDEGTYKQDLSLLDMEMLRSLLKIRERVEKQWRSETPEHPHNPNE